MGSEERVIWKHIGLHGHTVGTFTADKSGIQWKSALMGGDDDVSTSRSIPGKKIKGARWTQFGKFGYLRLQTSQGSNTRHELRFDGFDPKAVDQLRDTLKNFYDVNLEKHSMSASGVSYGKCEVEGRNLVFRHMLLEDANEEGEEFEPRVNDELLSLDLAEVSQCVLPGNNRHEVELQFPESDTVEAGTDQLVSVRLYIPPAPDFENSDKATLSNAELLQQRIMKTANITNTTGDVLVEFQESQGTFLTPRGRYTIELYDRFLRMRGNKYDYKIKYDDISRLFLLPKPDDVHMAFVIALDKPIRQGQQRYQMLVLQTTKEQSEITVNLEDKALEKEYQGELQPVMTGSLSNLIAKTFKVIARKKVFIPGKFANANQQACVKCALRANEGHLYPLEKQFIFIHKPPVLIRFDEVESVEFQRYAGGQGSTRNFDLCVTLKASAVGLGGAKEYAFSGIDRTDYAGLYNFLSGKKIRIKNLEGVGDEPGPREPVYNENEIYGMDDEMGDEESEDEDFDANAKDSDDGSDSADDDIDDDEMGSEVDDEIDSDIEEAKKKTKKEAKKRKAEASHENDDDDDSAPKAKKKKETPVKKGKKKKDPNAPKNAMSAYFLYSIATRSKVKEENPDATFGDIARIISSNFKALTDEQRAKWDRKAEVDKERYTEEMSNYDAPVDDDNDDENDDDDAESPVKKSKKEAKKDPKAPKKAKSGYNYFMSENRAKLKEENPEASFGELAKLVSSAYKALDADEKEKYEEMAREDKKRYKGELDDYSPQKGSKQDLAKNKKISKGKGKGKEKDPNAPKRGTTAFFFFMKDARAAAKEENPDLKVTELTKLLAEKFKALSEGEKAKYEKKAKNDKERYQKEMVSYEKKKEVDKSAEGIGVSDDDNDDDEDLIVDDDSDDDSD